MIDCKFRFLIVLGALWMSKTPTTHGEEPRFEKHVFKAEDGRELLYRMRIPRTVAASESGSTKYPLVLFLHGAGERGNDNEAQLKHGIREFATGQRCQQHPAILVAPQCPEESQWVETDWSQTECDNCFPSIPSEPMSLVYELVESLISQELVDTSRIYVTGLSMGGYGSWYAAGDGRIRFAAMVAVCGGGDSQWSDRYADTNLWAIHGDADPVVPVGRSRTMVSAIINAGHAGEIRYTELPGVNHDSWTATYANPDTYEWMFSQRLKGSQETKSP